MEYVLLQLCRDVYHCTPLELDEQDWGTISVHLALLTAESKVREAEAKERR